MEEPHRILYVADIRSPLSRNWISLAVSCGYEAVCFSTKRCVDGETIPVPTSWAPHPFTSLQASLHQLKGRENSEADGGSIRTMSPPAVRQIASYIVHLRSSRGGRPSWHEALEVWAARANSKRLQQLINSFQPDIVHSLRIPFEGITAMHAVPPQCTLVTSIWGNDLTLHANRSRRLRDRTELTLARTNGLHADARRDLSLANSFHFDSRKPSLVAPTGGGVPDGLFSMLPASRDEYHADADDLLIVNPRGARDYVRYKEFLGTVPALLDAVPKARVLCTGLRGIRDAERIVERHSLGSRLQLLPQLSQPELFRLLRLADIMVSPTVHDGTPNTLLEAMAAGALPVVSDLESVREWITHERNGLLFDPYSEKGMSQAIIRAAKGDVQERLLMADRNRRLVKESASRLSVAHNLRTFYREVWCRTKRT